MRKEQIEQAVQEAFLQSGIDKESFKQGIEWADQNPVNYDGKAMLHVLHKGAAIGRREMLDKACIWLANNAADYVSYEGLDENDYAVSTFDGRQLVKDFKKAMEEQQ